LTNNLPLDIILSMEDIQEILRLQKAVQEGIEISLTGQDEYIAREIVKREIASKGICPECATILSQDTDCRYCKGCGATFTTTN